MTTFNQVQETYNDLFSDSMYIVILQDCHGNFKAWNKTAETLEYPAEIFFTFNFEHIDTLRTIGEIHKQFRNLLKNCDISHFETMLRTRSGAIREVHITSNVIDLNGGKYVQNIIFDITERRREEINRQSSRDKLNRRLKERAVELKTANANLLDGIEKRKQTEGYLRAAQEDLEEKNRSLGDVNAALRVLLKTRDEDKDDLGKKVLANVEELILPSLLELRRTSLSEKQRSCIDILQANLGDIASSFSQAFSLHQIKLTPVEFKVATLIKQGRSSKAISDYLNISQRTVDWHRANIRRKLGLDHKNVNLRSYLSNLE
jgi:PAS domain S-box-containing protein